MRAAGRPQAYGGSSAICIVWPSLNNKQHVCWFWNIMRESKASVAAEVREWIDSRPVVVEAVRLGIANHSAIARMMADEQGSAELPAIMAACRRFARDREGPSRERAISRMLAKSRVETRTKIATITLVQGVDVLQRLGDV